MYLDGRKKQIIRWVGEGLSDRVIAERVRVSPSTVRYWRERNGIARPARDGVKARQSTVSRPKPGRESEPVERRRPRLKDFCDLMRLVGDADRLAMLRMLERGERLSTEFMKSLGTSLFPVRHSLSMMRASGLVVRRREGAQHFYSLTDRGRVLAELARKVGA